MLVPGFTGSPLDRADALRQDEAALAEALRHPDARLLRLDALDPVLEEDGRLSWGSLAEAPAEAPLALLGLDHGAPRFVALADVPHAARRTAALNAALARMAAPEAATYAAARSLIDWHARHRFCAESGHPTQVNRGGWGRVCPREAGGCGALHFPRVDPVVIMLAEHDGAVLVARQPRFPAGRFSALAGFVEPGESIEEAVRREIHEEAGVCVGAVRYVASQPWPMPSQLMIACIAQAEDRALALDHNELEEAMWVTRDEVVAALAGDPRARFGAPPAYAIAHTLLDCWSKAS